MLLRPPCQFLQILKLPSRRYLIKIQLEVIWLIKLNSFSKYCTYHDAIGKEWRLPTHSNNICSSETVHLSNHNWKWKIKQNGLPQADFCCPHSRANRLLKSRYIPSIYNIFDNYSVALNINIELCTFYEFYVNKLVIDRVILNSINWFEMKNEKYQLRFEIRFENSINSLNNFQLVLTRLRFVLIEANERMMTNET